MQQDQTTALSLRAAYAFGAEHNLRQEVDDIRNMVIEWDGRNSSLRRGYIVELFEKHGIFDEFKDLHWNLGNTSVGENKRRWYLRLKARYEDFLRGRSPGLQSEEEEAEQQFAAETDLRGR
jgi:hypothetical protein